MKPLKAFTLMELLVVVLILGLLATLAVGVYVTHLERARVAAAKTTIAEIELAAERYKIDIGQYPPSGSFTQSSTEAQGCGWAFLALTSGLANGSTSSTLWLGPYINVKTQQLGDINGNAFASLPSTPNPADVQILDPWYAPFRFVRSPDYATMGGTKVPASSPLASVEVYFNPSTTQIASRGQDNLTLPVPNYGLDGDDVTNFGF
jgi:prepilin-type N-terminal cleavage/methylation domain-containing protein